MRRSKGLERGASDFGPLVTKLPLPPTSFPLPPRHRVQSLLQKQWQNTFFLRQEEAKVLKVRRTPS